MSLLSAFITVVVPGLITLVATLLQYYIPKFSERKSQRIQILKLISVEYDVVRRYMTVVQRSRIYYFIVLFIFYFPLAIFGNITVIFKQYDKYIYLITYTILGLIVLFAVLVKTYSRTHKIPKFRKSANNKSTNLVEKEKWYDLLDAMFFLHWKSIRNVSIIIFLIFLYFLC